MRVSVCIVSAGRRELIDVLNSLGNQTLLADEVLVLVDGDRPVAEEVAKRFSWARVGVATGLTLGGARNRMVDGSSGELVVFLDDDVVVPPEFMFNLVEAASGAPDVGVFGGPNLTMDDVGVREGMVGGLLGNSVVTGPFARRFRPLRASSADLEGLVLCNLAVRRASWQPFSESLREGEETELLHRLVGDGVKVLASPDLSVWHRRRRDVSGVFEQIRRYGRGRSQAMRVERSALRPVLAGAGFLGVCGLVLGRWLVLAYSLLIVVVGLATGVRLGSLRGGLESVGFTVVIHLAYPLGLAEGLVLGSQQCQGKVVWLGSGSADPAD